MENIGWLCLGWITGFLFNIVGFIIIILKIKTNFDVKIKSRKEG